MIKVRRLRGVQFNGIDGNHKNLFKSVSISLHFSILFYLHDIRKETHIICVADLEKSVYFSKFVDPEANRGSR